MNKNRTVAKSKSKVKSDPVWHSFDDVFKKSRKKAAFRKAYDEELVRLKLAQQIRSFRSAKRLTQKAVAQRSGMSQSVVARIESGERGLTIDTLGKIANALGKEVQLV